MSIYRNLVLSGVAAVLAACGGAQTGGTAESADPCGGDPCGADAANANPCGGDDAGVGPLGVGAGYEEWTVLANEKWKSKTHGSRMVLTYVNDIGLEAYKDDSQEIPVGTVVVKPSWESDGAPGPVFVMEKRGDDFDPENENWYYAMYWPEVAPKWQKRLGEAVYWQSPSKKVDYCVRCHENYDRYLGGIPDEVKSY